MTSTRGGFSALQIEIIKNMKIALDEAAKARDKGNVAVGAAIVQNGEILARGHNEVDSSFDITADAETGTIRKMIMAKR